MTGQLLANLNAVRGAAEEGLNAQQIAERLDICRNYVHILAKQGGFIVARSPRPRRSEEQVTAAEIRRKYFRHRAGASQRGISFNLTQAEWWRIWDESGHWAERGRGSGYMMCRFRDEGGYEVGNVRITTGKENVREAVYFSDRSTSRLVPVPPSDPDHPVTPQSLHQRQNHSHDDNHRAADQGSSACSFKMVHQGVSWGGGTQRNHPPEQGNRSSACHRHEVDDHAYE